MKSCLILLPKRAEDAEDVDHEAAERAADELGRQWEPDPGLRDDWNPSRFSGTRTAASFMRRLRGRRQVQVWKEHFHGCRLCPEFVSIVAKLLPPRRSEIDRVRRKKLFELCASGVSECASQQFSSCAVDELCVVWLSLKQSVRYMSCEIRLSFQHELLKCRGGS